LRSPAHHEEIIMRHTTALLGAASIGVSVAAWGATARAQEANYFEQALPAPTNAIELKVGTGYTQGFGRIAPDRGVPDVAGPGIGVGVDADYRAAPRWSLGLEGEYQEFQSARNLAARGAAANVGFTYHTAPSLRGDPFVRLGAGYRLLWDVSPPGEPTTLRHGFELAKATVGYDIRLSSGIALAPQIGADVNLFLWQDRNGVNRALSSPQVGTFVFAGLQGRFDIGGGVSNPYSPAEYLGKDER
jgi:hypothetical protein